MKSPETEFTRELEVFYSELTEAITYFYSWITMLTVARDDNRVSTFLNQRRLFWNSVLGALNTASFIVLGRIFDEDPSTHNIKRLLEIAWSNLTIFSKEALAERKRRFSADADEWLTEYLRKVYVPTANDIRRLQRYVAVRRKIYKKKYQPLRHRLLAHKERIDSADIKALYTKTEIRELEQLLIFLRRLYEALSELLINGRKPNLPVARYSIKAMRERPSPGHRLSTVPESLIRETEQFLKSQVGDLEH